MAGSYNNMEVEKLPTWSDRGDGVLIGNQKIILIRRRRRSGSRSYGKSNDDEAPPSSTRDINQWIDHA